MARGSITTRRLSSTALGLPLISGQVNDNVMLCRVLFGRHAIDCAVLRWTGGSLVFNEPGPVMIEGGCPAPGAPVCDRVNNADVVPSHRCIAMLALHRVTSN